MRFQRGFWDNHSGTMFENVGSGQSFRKIAPNASQTGPKRQGQAKASSRHPLVGSAFFGQCPRCGEGPWWRIPVGPVAPSVVLPVSVRPWLVSVLFSRSSVHIHTAKQAALQFIFCNGDVPDGRNIGCRHTVARSTIRRRRPGVPRLAGSSTSPLRRGPSGPAGTRIGTGTDWQTNCPSQSRMENGSRRQPVVPKRRRGHACAARPLQLPASGRKRRNAARRAAEVKAAKRAKHHNCMRELRLKQRQDLGETEFKRRVACDRKAQRTAAKAEDSCAGGVTSVWCAPGGWSAIR